jgi:predicted membrane channel-forming protein YqfA (hemolysin III family)
MAITVALVAAVGIALHFSFQLLSGHTTRLANVPLYVALAVGGIPLVAQLVKKLWSGDFGSDFLAGVSIVTGILLREYLVATIVVLMLFRAGDLQLPCPALRMCDAGHSSE